MRDAVNRKRALRGASADEGWALIETLIAAVVLVIVVLGVYSALESSTHAAGFDRQRSTAAALAEQDLERLRGISASGFTSDIPDRYEDADGNEVPQTDPKASYKVQSSATWVHDGTGAEETCADADTEQGSYLKITATVTPIEGQAAGVAGSPVTMTSLMAPNAEMTQGRGTLAVRVKSSTGAAAPNVPVTLSSGDVRTTNAAGCAVFGFIPVGSYGVQAPSNLVDKGGVAGGQVTANVTENAVKTVELKVDTAATLSVTVQTKLQDGSIVADKSDGIVAANAEVPTGYRQFPGTQADGTETLTGLFPFAGGYTVYSGTCLSADPAKYVPNYYAANPGVVTLPPDGNGTLTVREPALNIRVTRDGSVYRSAKVVVYAQSGDCADHDYTFNGVTAQGALPSPGLPFGDYRVCVTDGTHFYETPDTALVQNRNPDGNATMLALAIPTSGSWGRCP